MGKLSSLLLKEASLRRSSQWKENQIATISPSPMDLIFQSASVKMIFFSDLYIE
jgi:hypothetical protein